VTRTEFSIFVEEALALAGPISVRAMFGGYGVYLDDAMFGLIADDVLYLKVDGENRDAFVAAGLEPFVYAGKHRPMEMSYHRAPEPLEDWDRLAPWVDGAIAAARRARAARRPRRPRSSGSSNSADCLARRSGWGFAPSDRPRTLDPTRS